MRLRPLAALAALLALAGTAEARPRHPAKPTPEMAQALAALDDRVSDCFAESVLNNPAARVAAKAGRWYDAAGIAGYACRSDAGVMMRAHDGIAGRGAGFRYFRTTYARRLDKALAARVAPRLVRADYAEALPPKDPASSPAE